MRHLDPGKDGSRDFDRRRAMASANRCQTSLAFPLVLLTLAVPSGRALAAAPPDVLDRQQVTAVDVLVEIGPRRSSKEAGPSLPSYLGPDDFEVRIDGEVRSVVDVGAFGAAQEAPDREPWTFVIYFDRSLVNPADAGWAAGELVENAERLTGLGSVEVVAADPSPRRLLDPTRDPELLGSVLAEIALFPEGDDHDVLRLRDELLAELANPESEIDPDELVVFALAEEKRLVRRQLDAFLSRLTSSESVTAGGARRAVFLVQGGFDLHPEEFYRPHLRHSKTQLGKTAELGDRLGAVARTLAAYGWIVFPLTPPEEPAARGLWLGNWRLERPRGEARETPLDPLQPHDTVSPVLLNFLRLTREGKKDAEKAAAFFELGERLFEQSDFSEAEQAFRMTLFHYGDDEATVRERAAAFNKLGAVLQVVGRRREARAAFERAHELEPGGAARTEEPLAELLEAEKSVRELAEGTAGLRVAGSQELARVLAGLPYRVRVTYQVPGIPEGKLHAIEVRCKRRGCKLRAPLWARSGAPDEVAEARFSRWLADEQFEGVLELHGRHGPGPNQVEVDLLLPQDAHEAQGGGLPADPLFRVSLGYGDPEEILTMTHQRRKADHSGSSEHRLRIAYDPELLPRIEGRSVAVLIEDLETGRWGATVIEVPAADAPPAIR